jgi:hypothetical protein
VDAVGAVNTGDGTAAVDTVGAVNTGDATGAVDTIRYAAASYALASAGTTIFPEEHQKSGCCLHVNKALSTQLNTEFHHNHNARRHCF